MKASLSLAVYVLVVCGFGCTEPKTGANNIIEFTPMNCGRTTDCNFDDGIGAGGRIDVQIRAVDAYPTAGLNLISADPSLFQVQPTVDINDAPTWEISAIVPGSVHLSVIDSSDGEEVDYIEFDVLPVDAISSFSADSDDRRAATTVSSDEGWLVDRDNYVVFTIEPMFDGDSTMGRFDYLVTLDPEIEAGLNTAPESGRLSFKVPSSPDEYYASFDNQLGHDLTIVFWAR